MSDPQITVYGFEYSGHAHRVVLLLRMLEIPFRYIAIPRGARRTPEFLKLNPLGQILCCRTARSPSSTATPSSCIW